MPDLVLDLGTCNLKARPSAPGVVNGLALGENYCRHLLLNHSRDSIQNWLDRTEEGLKELSSSFGRIRRPVDCLLPGSLFTCRVDDPANLPNCQYKKQDSETGNWHGFSLNLDPSLQLTINRMLDKAGIEARFLGAAFAAELEYVLDLSLKESYRGRLLCLLSSGWSAVWLFTVRDGTILSLHTNPSLSTRRLDEEIQTIWQCRGDEVPGIKEGEVVFLPIFRDKQFEVDSFRKLSGYFLGFCEWLVSVFQTDETQEKSLNPLVFYTGGGFAIRNMEVFFHARTGFEFLPLVDLGDSFITNLMFSSLWCHAKVLENTKQ